MPTPALGLQTEGGSPSALSCFVANAAFEAQWQAILKLLGTGTVGIPGNTALQVQSASGGAVVNVAAGQAITHDATRGYTVVTNPNTVAGPPLADFEEGENFVYAVTSYRPLPLDGADPADSRETGAVTFDVLDTEVADGAGAVLLAKVTVVGGLVTAIDNTVRAYSSIGQLPAIVAAIGLPYDAEDLGTIKDRLAAHAAAIAALQSAVSDLQGSAGIGSSLLPFWDAQQRSSSDPTAIAAFVAAQIAAAQAAANASPVSAIPQASPAQMECNLMIAYYGALTTNNSLPNIAPLINAFVDSPGRGHCVEGDVLSGIDYAHSDVAIIFEDEHLFKVAS